MPDDQFNCRCVLCHDYGDREEADRVDLVIQQHVGQFGWHVVMVPEDEIGPGFAYTIGLTHSLGSPELAMFGLSVSEMHKALNVLGEKARSGDRLADGQMHADILGQRPVLLRSTDLRWYRTFFGRAIDFYRRPPFPVLQVTWPDSAEVFPWHEQCSDQHRQSQPQLWLSPAEHPQGVWTAEL